jgi:hypothetical protein
MTNIDVFFYALATVIVLSVTALAAIIRILQGLRKGK